MPYEFKFSVDGHKRFVGTLQVDTCVHVNQKSHQRCKRRVSIGVPYCWQHMQVDKHLKIKASTIPGAGKGLYAYDGTRNSGKVVFKPKQLIADYDGEHISKAVLVSRYGSHTAPYGAQLTKDTYEDGALRRGIGTLPNHSTRRFTNAELIVGRTGGRPEVKVRATKNIRSDKEVLVSYGRAYKMSEDTTHTTTRKRRS